MKIWKKNRLILNQLKKLISARKALNQTSRDQYLQCRQPMCLSTPSSKPRNSCNHPKIQKIQTRKKTKKIQKNLKNKLRKIILKTHHERDLEAWSTLLDTENLDVWKLLLWSSVSWIIQRVKRSKTNQRRNCKISRKKFW